MKKFFLLALVFGLTFTSIPSVHAALNYSNVLGNVGNGAGLTSGSTGEPKVGLITIIGTIMKTALGLLGVVLLLLTIYAGFMWMTAQGNEEQVTKAKTMIRNAVIGLIITLAAYSIASFVTGQISTATLGQ